jgi:N-hydroxyarylamine O-acetyltransferase
MLGAGAAEYLTRIGLAAAPSPDPVGLAAVVRAHRLSIPFENLDILLGRGVSLAPEAVFAKLVLGGRGGYCFEHNLLLCRMLANFGLSVEPMLARARLQSGPGDVPPRTHLVLRARIAGEDWIADAGFGGDYAPPMRLAEHVAEGAGGILHRLRRVGERGSDSGEWLLERSPDRGQRWQAQYSFDALPAPPVDIELANHWTSTRKGVRFTTVHVVGRVTARGTTFLTDRDFSETGRENRVLSSAQEWHGVLNDRFGVALSLAEVRALPLFAA